MQPIDKQTAGIGFEILRTYSFCVALTAAHFFARLKSIPLVSPAPQMVTWNLLEKSFAKYCGKPLTKSCGGKPAMAQFKMGIQIASDGHRVPGRGLGGGSVSLGHRQLA
jgi:hypothetical protein